MLAYCLSKTAQLITSVRSLTLHVQPVDFLRAHTDPSAENRIRIQHGTTTLAFKFQGGIVVAVDSRASGGSYIGM